MADAMAPWVSPVRLTASTPSPHPTRPLSAVIFASTLWERSTVIWAITTGLANPTVMGTASTLTIRMRASSAGVRRCAAGTLATPGRERQPDHPATYMISTSKRRCACGETVSQMAAPTRPA